MNNFIKKVRAWYDKWLRPRRSPSKIFAEEIGKALEAEEEIEWPKENPYIKAAPEDATFTAETRSSPDVAKAFTALNEACKQAAEALVRAARVAADCVVAITRGVDIAQLLKTAKEVPPRVRHLAQHSKKYRTRKKNINRALREYQRRTR